MEGKLEFNLNDYDDKRAFIRCTKVDDVYIALHRIAYDVFRPSRKYGFLNNNELSEEQLKVVEELESMFYDVLEDLNIDMDSLD